MRNFIFIFLVVNLSLTGQSKYNEYEKILIKFKEVNGSKDCPILKLINSQTSIASFHQKSNTIFIEEKALKICREFKKDSLTALAFILGHEFSHFLQKKSIISNFYKENLCNDNLDSLAEWNADVNSFFLMNQLGYNSKNVIPQLLDKLYLEYNLSSTNNLYPDLDTRKKSKIAAINKSIVLSQYFEIANDCVALGKYDIAKELYNEILKEYKGPEVQHNLALSIILESLNYGITNKLAFVMPFELDWRSRIRKPPVVRGDEAHEFSKSVLSKLYKALEILNTCSSDFPSYNKAVESKLFLLFVLGKIKECYQVSKEVNNRNAVELVLALIEYKEYKNSIPLRNLARNSHHQFQFIAKENLDFLNSKINYVTNSCKDLSSLENSISNILSYKFDTSIILNNENIEMTSLNNIRSKVISIKHKNERFLLLNIYSNQPRAKNNRRLKQPIKRQCGKLSNYFNSEKNMDLLLVKF